MNEPPRLAYRIAEVSKMLHVSPGTVRALITSGALRCVKVGPKCLLIRADDLNSWIEKNTVQERTQ